MAGRPLSPIGLSIKGHARCRGHPLSPIGLSRTAAAVAPPRPSHTLFTHTLHTPPQPCLPPWAAAAAPAIRPLPPSSHVPRG